VKASLNTSCRHHGTSISNGVDHVENIAPTDVGDLSVLPVWKNVTLNRATYNIDRFIVRLIPLKPFLEHTLKVSGPVTGRSDAARIASGLDIMTGLTPSVTGLGKTNGGIRAEGQAA